MIENQNSFPDLLRRFVATPYVFTNDNGPGRLSVQSNDLEIALAVRRHWIDKAHKNHPAVISWKIIRDVTAPHNPAGLFILDDRNLRTLMIGTGTILFFDVERAEVSGFISAQMTIGYLFSSLIPKLLKL